MVQIGLMIEGQDGLNWARWKRLLQAAEDLGFQSIFRSDHFTNAGPPDKDSLELWVSLTYAASTTKRIEFGPLVSPVTFRHPSMTVRMAAAVDDLSGGRLVLGLGAGWQEREHNKFGIPFYDFNTRFDMLTDALAITTRLLASHQPVTYRGRHFSVDDALLLPRPARPGGPPVLIGGNGPDKTLPLAAQYAQEWNAVFAPLDLFKQRSARLDELLHGLGREPHSVKRSLMTRLVYDRDAAALQRRIETTATAWGRSDGAAGLRAAGMIVGHGPQVVEQIGQYAQVGVQRVMLQWLDLDDLEGLEQLAADVLPAFL
jgi:F420-dependent oxidoreductase-like protein